MGVSRRTVEQKRPLGLNTVQLLKTASSAFGMSADYTMRVAETLYLRGFVTYPRTESTAYPANFSFTPIISALAKAGSEYGNLGGFAKQRLGKEATPRKGVDVGDHPPITPVQLGTGLSGDYSKLYSFISCYFLASIS